METACYIDFEYSTYYKNWQYIIKIRENITKDNNKYDIIKYL